MKKRLLFLTTILLLGAGCVPSAQSPNTRQDKKTIADNLVNTFRDARLLFQINYPQNWVITNYIDYTKNDGCIVYKEKGFVSKKYGEDVSESCGEGTELVIASFPSPYGGWSLGYPPPAGYIGIEMTIKPYHNGFYDDKDSIYRFYDNQYKSSKNIIERKNEISIGEDSNKINIIVYDYKDESKNEGEGLPTAIAYYYGDNYVYEFSIMGSGPRSEKEISYFKQIVSSFKEIK